MILAIIERYEKIEKQGTFSERYYLTKNYKDIFDKLNVLLFPIFSDNNLDKVADICDGLILTGSKTDINPKYYGEQLNVKSKIDIDEYKFDSKVISFFSEKHKPILGICGGMQSINVYFGGSLYQDIENHSKTEHKIRIEKDSFLYKTYNKKEMFVNSLHHQAIKQVANGFKITAIDDGETIEAIEKDNIIGVQWHPEKMQDILFFETFIKEYF